MDLEIFYSAKLTTASEENPAESWTRLSIGSESEEKFHTM